MNGGCMHEGREIQHEKASREFREDINGDKEDERVDSKRVYGKVIGGCVIGEQ